MLSGYVISKFLSDDSNSAIPHQLQYCEYGKIDFGETNTPSTKDRAGKSGNHFLRRGSVSPFFLKLASLQIQCFLKKIVVCRVSLVKRPCKLVDLLLITLGPTCNNSSGYITWTTLTLQVKIENRLIFKILKRKFAWMKWVFLLLCIVLSRHCPLCFDCIFLSWHASFLGILPWRMYQSKWSVVCIRCLKRTPRFPAQSTLKKLSQVGKSVHVKTRVREIRLVWSGLCVVQQFRCQVSFHVSLLCVALFCFIKPILGNRYGPGVIPYGRGSGVAGFSPSTLTTSLATPVPSSSSSNGPTTTPLTTRGLCPGGSVGLRNPPPPTT